MLVLASASPARRRLLEQAAIPHRVEVSGVAEEELADADPRRLVGKLARAKATAVRDRLLSRPRWSAGPLAETGAGELGAFGEGPETRMSPAVETTPGAVAPRGAAEGRQGQRPPGAGERLRAVLGCDSVLVVEGEVFGKPASAAEARRRWRHMAGGWGELHTGHCLLPWRGLSAGGSPEMSDGAGGDWLATVTTRVRFAPLAEDEIAAYVASGEPLRCAGGFALEGRGGLVVEAIEGCVSNVIGLSLPLLRRWLRDLDQGRGGESPLEFDPLPWGGPG